MDFKKHAAKAYQKTRDASSDTPKKTEQEKPETPKPGMLKTSPESEKRSPRSPLESSGAPPSKTDIAKYLLAIGPDQAAQILKHLPEDAVEDVVREVSRIRVLDPKERDTILAKFDYLFAVQRPTPTGGVETARGFLVQAFGQEKGESLLRKALPDQVHKHFEFLEGYEARQIHTLMKSEGPALRTLVFAHLSPQKTAGVLKLLPKEEQLDILRRLSRLEKLDRDIMVSVEEALRERIRKLGTPQDTEIDGKGVLAEILKNMDAGSESTLLHYLEDADPELGTEIKERLFTIETLLYIEDRDLQKVLQDVENGRLALIMKGKSEEIRRKILGNLSQSRAQVVIDEYQYLGPKRRSEIDEATREFVRYLKSLEEKGELLVRRDNDEYI